MASLSPVRPSRRAATRRKIIVDDSDEENLGEPRDDADDGEDFKPAPQFSPKRQTRRKTDVPATPRTAARTRRARTGDNVEPSEIFDVENTMPLEQGSPTKKASLRKRKSAAPARKTRGSVALDAPPQMPTPRPPTAPDSSQAQGAPLADITQLVINEQAPPANSQKDFFAVKAMDTVLEKPMDIVIRSRALAVPQQPEDTGLKARTVITRLVLTNFKSYAGKQEVGPFHASFSSVVGPNGSGKSNVIDSLLFVFGFRASKMRQGKISALIHNSAAFPDLDYCEVEVHFQEVMDVASNL
ncbi:hypothetical protein MMC21_001810 [Puttea exsequens]|nr:hypothetical protein [Puttea exsequens]